jgi:flagellar protein FlaG
VSIQVNSRAAAPSQATVLPADPKAAAPAVAKAEPTPAPKIEHVDLGFRAEEMRKKLQEAVSRLNEQLKSKGRDLSFSLDERIDRTIITVKNLQTGEVVRQIPTEEVVRMAHSIEDMKGVLFNEVL